ncbi:MAG: histidine kinase [Rhodanobacter sp. 68-29]|nr:FecR domain-containing protein [Rhodanobacter sp.]ODU73884.1 MAG: histidine kinase [Rhodanobacter sp. SCN 69-32]OJY55269.1 MAG: histidine kinase [Rhodanobacter sp. 68-29]
MVSSRQIEHIAAAWLARRDSGRWSAADEASLDEWLADATAHKVAFLRLEAAWREAGRLQALGAGLSGDRVPPPGRWAQPHEVELAAPSVSRRRNTRRRPLLRWLTGAAAVAVLAVAGTVSWQRGGIEPVVQYDTAVGQLSEVSLSDGSQATLSSDSRIRVAWTRNRRQIDLERGEAYFHVAKNPGKPFVVEAGKRQVVAVGTRFAVRRDGDALRVVVTEGVVRLEPAGADGKGSLSTLLPAGSVAQLDGNGLLVRSLPLAQAKRYLDWRDGYVSFHDTPLASAVMELNRYSVRKIVVVDPAIAHLPLGGHFRWSNTQAFVNLLTAAFPVRAVQQGNQVLLYAR